jgi:hypothetical protein
MSSFPGSPKVQKGAIVGVDPFNPLASVIVFQYNPERMTRTLQVQAAGGEGGGFSEALRLKGAPVETIKVDVEIDATDQLEAGDGNTTSLGIYPQLSALELLAYPKSALVITNTVLMALGTIEVIPPTGPLTLFVWGLKRVLPVRLTEFSITEEAFDVSLNPIRAQVSLGLRVLSYNDVPLLHPAYAIFLAHQVAKEVMATISSFNNLKSVVGGDVKLF